MWFITWWDGCELELSWSVPILQCHPCPHHALPQPGGRACRARHPSQPHRPSQNSHSCHHQAVLGQSWQDPSRVQGWHCKDDGRAQCPPPSHAADSSGDPSLPSHFLWWSTYTSGLPVPTLLSPVLQHLLHCSQHNNLPNLPPVSRAYSQDLKLLADLEARVFKISHLFKGNRTKSSTNGTTTTPSPAAGPEWRRTTTPSPSAASTTSTPRKTDSLLKTFDESKSDWNWYHPLWS